MKRTKREENAIVINFLVYFICIVLSIFIGINYFYSNIQEIEDKKQETKSLFTSMKDMKTKGLKLSDLKKNYHKNLDDADKKTYVKSIVESLKPDFYRKNFINNSTSSYDSFLRDKSVYYKDKTSTENKLLSISKLIPSYSENIYELNEKNSLTDFKFLNYVESLISTFNLKYNNSIGITNLTVLNNYSLSKKDSSLDKNIYYIPLELDIEGRKSSIIDFLYYIDNVAKIYIDDSGDIQVFSLDDKKSANKKETGSGQLDTKESHKKQKSYDESYFESFQYKRLDYNYPFGKNYNIFDNQILEIENISFAEYIDSNPGTAILSNQKEDLLQYLRSSGQLKERFSVKLKLRFYIKGLPKYKIEHFITSVKSDYKKFSEELTKTLKDGNVSTLETQKITNVNNTLKTINDGINALNIKGGEKTLSETYEEAFRYKGFLEKLKEQIKK